MLEIILQCAYNILSFFSKKRLVLCACNFEKDIYINLTVLYDILCEKRIKSKFLLRNKNTVLDLLVSLYYLSCSRVVIVDCSHWLISKIKICNKTTIIFVGHGGGCYKRMGFSKNTHINDENKLIKLYGQYDYVISTSMFFDDFIKMNYTIPQQNNTSLLKVGLPRTDLLFFQKHQTNNNIVLFAPSFAELNGKRCYSWDFNLLDKIAKKHNLKIWFCGHPDVRSKLIIPDGWYDCSNQQYEMKMLIPSVLLTDRSSIMFDFSITEKPILIFDNLSYKTLWITKEQLKGVNVCQSYNDIEDKLSNRRELLLSKDLRDQQMNRCNGKCSLEIVTFIDGVLK